MKIKVDWKILPFYLLAIGATWVVGHHVFFWDTIQLGSKHAHWYFEHDFKYFLLPPTIDSGHPPTFGMYIALMWKWLGKTLIVSHFVILPFTLLSIGLLHQIGNYFLDAKSGIGLVLLMVADPTFAAQSLLVSPDVALFCCFLLGLYAVLKSRSWLLALACLGLASISMRGMMVVLVLFLANISFDYICTSVPKSFTTIINKYIFPFIPSGVLAASFLAYHYWQTGWIGYHADSPWAASFERVDAMGFVRNIALLCWRLLDFGRVLVVLVTLVLLFKKWRRNQPFSMILKWLLSLNIIAFLILCPTLLIYDGLLGHRYLMPIFFLNNLLCLYLIFQQSSIQQTVIFSLVLVSLLTGNLWIYPKQIAQGWDATLAHLPYYALRSDMIQYIEQENIEFEQVGTVFPEIGERKFKELNDLELGFVPVSLNENQYIFYASVMNDFSDEVLETLENEWIVLKQLKKGRIEVILYQRP